MMSVCIVVNLNGQRVSYPITEVQISYSLQATDGMSAPWNESCIEFSGPLMSVSIINSVFYATVQ